MKKNYSGFEKKLNKNKMLLLTAACSAALLFSGCQSRIKSLNDVNTEINQSVNDKSTENDDVDDKSTENDSYDANTPEKPDVAEDITPAVTEYSSKESIDLFSDMSKYQFVFASGAGAWQTMLTINEDGTFAGEYHDSEMGDVGEDYPYGVVYSSTFEGKLTEPKKINDYTYSVSIEYLNLEKEIDNEEILDGIRYIYSEPYGINDAIEILIYTPEAPVKELPEEFRSWVGLMNLDDLKDEHLGFYGLYNVETESGFSSYTLD